MLLLVIVLVLDPPPLTPATPLAFFPFTFMNPPANRALKHLVALVVVVVVAPFGTRGF